MLTSNGRFSRKLTKTDETLMSFCDFWNPSCVPKCNKNQPKNLLEDKVRFSINLFLILVDFGRQVRVEMAPKIDAKTHRKNDANSDAFWMRLGWVFRWTRNGSAAQAPPPFTLFFKKQTKHTNAQDQ